MSRSAKRSSAVQSVQKSAPSFVAAPDVFVAGFYDHLLPTDLALFSGDERARIAASAWALTLTRRPRETKLRIYNPSLEKDGWAVDHTVIELVSDDMPFIVDSVTGVLQRAGYAVHMVIHPVLRLTRGPGHKALSVGADGAAESFMHVQIDRCIDPAQLKEIEAELRGTMADVTAAVDDWRAMRDKMAQTADALPLSQKTGDGAEDGEEVRAFLHWLCDDNFTFLGCREIDLRRNGDDAAMIRVVPGKGLGVLRDDEARMFGGLRDYDKKQGPALRQYVRQNHVLFVTKTNAVTRVHRILPMDAVFIRSFDESGAVVSEKLFVGLFTSKTYAQTPQDIPFMRRKIADVSARMGFNPKSHDGRALTHILNTYPHDELFQISEDELYANVLGILQLQERARVALFTRRDPFGRYVTCLIYVPRDRYDSALRARIQDFLEAAYGGKAQTWNVRIDDGQLARAFVAVRLTTESPNPDPAALEADLRALCRSWNDRLRDLLVASLGEAEALAMLRRYGDIFPRTYRETVPPSGALLDIGHLERMRAAPRFIAAIGEAGDGPLRIKILSPERPLSLSRTLPMLENMGLKIDYTGGPYEVKFKDGCATAYIHEFVGRPACPLAVPFDDAKPAFEEGLFRVLAGDAESDPFNALALRAGLAWRDIAVLRAFARYLRQLRIPYSHEIIAAALIVHPQMARQIVELFHTRHNPAFKGDRAAAMRALESQMHEALGRVSVLEEDRVIRRYMNLIQASLRTNYFQPGEDGQPKPYLSFKFDSRVVDFMPLPKPMFEIFVHSPRVEAVHLRGGKVARGGIRWSDRRDDFRAEVLGLMKAQMVKNTVIVPVGSKGGFIVKRPPAEADKMQAEGIACYRIMMRGLLDITDNRVGGKIAPPKNVVRHDGDDPYLVVAADKGTATFSDIANGIAQDYGFWLDDAFASGGSAGYDHKGMGITARGAWEAVKRHFRELGKDIQTTDFTCIGVGDMSGDVFGNGMLLSEHIRLLGAFDHRHIFCDPNPDAAKSFAERRRLFALPRSSWADYDRKLISKGGGVFARSEKSIRLTGEMKKAYGTAADALAPAELIQAMLKAEVELLYFGGIGTYVKAEDETHEQVGDRANEALRINGGDIRAKIVGEGANLGMTQRGRIDYALKGGRLNTDAIDNSAGVDTSDHEVNIKILLRGAVDRKALTIPARNKVLAGMTNDVARLVLRDNYLQTQALSITESQASDLLASQSRSMQLLEKAGLLNRAVEFLPDEAEIAERQRLGRGLTRPEMAVLLSYAKIWLCQKLLESKLPDDPALQELVTEYFPKAVRAAYAQDIARHQLRREIATTVLTNDIVNHMGAHAVLALADAANATPENVVRAYWLARGALDLPALWESIEALDNKIPAQTQIRMHGALRGILVEAVRRLLPETATLSKLSAGIEANRKGLAQIAEWLKTHAEAQSATFERMRIADIAAGVPEALARRVAQLPVQASVFDLTVLAARTRTKVGDLAALFFGLESRLGLDWLKQPAMPASLTVWQRQALRAALADLAAHHRRLTEQLAVGEAFKSGISGWAIRHAAALESYDALLAECRAAGSADLSILLLANERLAALSAQA